ncbi:hypothetical protein RQP46_001674 [Phenoliferia psychrophenolica]
MLAAVVANADVCLAFSTMTQSLKIFASRFIVSDGARRAGGDASGVGRSVLVLAAEFASRGVIEKGGKSDVDPAKVQDISAAMEKAGRESTASRPCQTCGKQPAEEVFPALSSALGLLTANPIHTTHALVVRATWHPEIKDATLAFTLDGAAPMPHADLEALLSGYGYDLVGYFSQDALNNVHGMKGAREGLNRCMAVWIAKWNGK